MSLRASVEPLRMVFKFKAGTSRGILTEKETYLLRVWDHDHATVVGMGEAAPLAGLSPDHREDYLLELQALCRQLYRKPTPVNANHLEPLLALVPLQQPAAKFALETALWDLIQGGRGMLFSSGFTEGREPIPINGLVWMGRPQFMKQQIRDKVAQGYECIKLKIGALDFQKECDLLQTIRRQYGRKIIIRVDANGAFAPHEATHKLAQLQEFQLHSIEQPIAPGQPELMRELCQNSPVPVALDEELIGITDIRAKRELLERLKPKYIILKPTLLGGFAATKEWISLAGDLDIGWWITSALESNVGLNAIAQFTATLAYQGHQGLGTGQLFENNTPSALTISRGYLHFEKKEISSQQ